MEIKFTLYFYQILTDQITETYNRDTRQIQDFEGFLIGTSKNNALQIMDVRINPATLGNQNTSSGEELDFSMKIAMIEDEIYADGRNYYILGIVRTHNKGGLIPTPRDLVDLSLLQSMNPNAVLMVCDVFQATNTANLGVSFYQLSDGLDPNGETITIDFEIEDKDDIVLSQLISKLKTNQVNFANVDAFVNKALVNIQANSLEDAEKYLKEAKSMMGVKLDSELAEKVDLNLLEIMYVRQNYGRLLNELDKLKNLYADKQAERLLGKIELLMARTFVRMDKIEASYSVFQMAISHFNLSKSWKEMALANLLYALVILPIKGSEESLKILIQALSALSNMRSDNEKLTVINKLNLEQNTKNMIKTLPNKDKQRKYLEILNNISEAHGYKLILEDF
jgi:hypothetical protein